MMMITRRTFHLSKVYHNRTFSTTRRCLHQKSNGKFRVAIIGAGASGMSTALHLAPLVERGLIAGPIDIYERSSPSDLHPHQLQSQIDDENFHPGSGHIGREVGVGIWNTALEPFLRNEGSDTHLNLIKDLQEKGKFVGRVGYRTPNGNWLTRGKLNTQGVYQGNEGSSNGTSTITSTNTRSNKTDPALLFIREKDFLSSLRAACEYEEKNYGTMRIHNSTEIKGVVLPKDITSVDEANSGYLQFTNNDSNDSNESNTNLSKESYHFIIAAEGIQSSLRMKYAGYLSLEKKWKKKTGISAKLAEQWEKQVLDEQNGIEDRKYTVFRGNSPLSDSDVNMDGTSFQTWGEGKSMRFAAVGMSHPSTSNDKERDEEQVWFATICDSKLIGIKDAEQRKKLLVDRFKDWHDPVRSLIESTPADEILMERAVAHKHSVYPVLNLSQVIHYQEQSAKRKYNESVHYSEKFPVGPGPILSFTGDAAITVDPVLAQGITIAMEAAADLAETLEISLTGVSNIDPDSLPFDPIQLREDMRVRNQRRYERMLCLIRASELVQAISQPSNPLSSFLSNNIIRPAMMITPSFLKEAVFSYMMKYSLGKYGSKSLYNKSSCDITQASRVNLK